MSVVINVLKETEKEATCGVFAELAANNPCLCAVYVPSGVDCGNGFVKYKCALDGRIMDVLFSKRDSRWFEGTCGDCVWLFSHAPKYGLFPVRYYWLMACVDRLDYNKWCELCYTYGIKPVTRDDLIKAASNTVECDSSITSISMRKGIRADAVYANGVLSLYVIDTASNKTIFSRTTSINTEVLSMEAIVNDIKTYVEPIPAIECTAGVVCKLGGYEQSILCKVVRNMSDGSILNVTPINQ